MTPAAVTVARVEQLDDGLRAGLSAVLIDCVDGGASVGFMAPVTAGKADLFWSRVAASLARGERLLYVARDLAGEVVGTVQVLLDQPENQPHRGDLAKMLVHRRVRRLGVGARLLAAAEAGARAAGRTLLLLDTASDDAARLYQRGGWRRSGTVPGYALMPDGRPCDTTFWFKPL